jgi:hypothetical protein
VLFFHHDSKSLIVTDLILHIAAQRAGIFGNVYLSLTGMNGQARACPLWRRWVKDRAAPRKSLHQLFSLEFERIVPAHGAVVTSEAQAVLRPAWTPFL